MLVGFDLIPKSFNPAETTALKIGVAYRNLLFQYLFQSRDQDSSLIFAFQYILFGLGPITEYVTKTLGLLGVILDCAEGWYSIGANHSAGLNNIVDRSARYDHTQMDFDPSNSSRLKKGTIILGHIRALFRHPEIERLVTESDFFGQLVAFVHMFVGLQPQTRQLEEHVEYEIEWARSFQMLAELGKICRSMGEAWIHSSVGKMIPSLMDVAGRIRCEMNGSGTHSSPTKYGMVGPLSIVKSFGIKTNESLYYVDMAEAKEISFHDYLHYLLAEMIKRFMRLPWVDGALSDGTTFPGLLERCMWTDDPNDKLLFLEVPMRSELLILQRISAHRRTRLACPDPS